MTEIAILTNGEVFGWTWAVRNPPAIIRRWWHDASGALSAFEGGKAMPTAKENEAQAREAYAAFAAGDLDKVTSIFHPDIVWRVDGSSSIARDYKGVEEVLGFFGTIFTETDGTFRNTIEDVIANEDTIVVITNLHAERKGKTVDTKQVAVYRSDADGKITEATFYGDDTTQFDAFWS
jgi:uncharacterized protein